MTMNTTAFEGSPTPPCFFHHFDMYSLQTTPTIGSDKEDQL